MKRWMLAAALLIALAGLAPAAPTRAADETCFPETGHCLGGRIRQYWQGNGGLPVFGYPINAQRQEVNRDTGQVYQTQWVERNRIELHPENQAPYDVLLGLLGKESLPADLRDWSKFRESGPQDGCLWFGDTGFNVCNQAGGLGFKAYWQSHGLEFDGKSGVSYAESLALFGYPLSWPSVRTNSSGDSVLTQWFERARFEWHPGKPDEYKVLLGLVGKEIFDPRTLTGGELKFHAVQRPGWAFPLEVPVGFTIDEVYSGLYSPRFMALDPVDASLVVADKNANNIVRLRDTDADGRYDQKQVVADGFDVMHSVAFVNGALYAADERHLFRLGGFGPDGRAAQVTTVLALPSGATDLYGHRTRTIGAGPDGYLYLSVGSSCDVCVESDQQRATVLRMRPDGSDVQIYASGLRNTVGFDWQPYTGALWGVDMGRNNIGATDPPDELNLIQPGKNYGWPYCYGNNQPNPEFNDQSRCVSPEVPRFNFPAHWSPLGIAFYSRAAFPASYQNDALIAFHGSGGDQVPNLTGYRVSRMRFDASGQPTALEDLVRGWYQDGEIWGRPCGVLVMPDGSVLISDDFNGRIYRLRTE
jgi:glucose/arabinose dehydrogenase